MPWPKPTVITVVSRQLAADWNCGAIAPGSSMGERSNIPIIFEPGALTLGADIHRDMRGAEVRGVGDHLRQIQPAVLALEIGDRDNGRYGSAATASNSSQMCTMPPSSAIDAVCNLNVLPGS